MIFAFFLHLITNTILVADQAVVFYPVSLQFTLLGKFFYWTTVVPFTGRNFPLSHYSFPAFDSKMIKTNSSPCHLFVDHFVRMCFRRRSHRSSRYGVVLPALQRRLPIIEPDDISGSTSLHCPYRNIFDRVCRQPRQSLTGMIKVALKPKTYAYGRAPTRSGGMEGMNALRI
jgi:hypothetical protein